MATGTIRLTQGDDYSEAMALTQDDGSGDPYDLTGCVLWFRASRRDADDDADALVLLDSDDDPTALDVTDAAGGLATFRLTAAQTAGFGPGAYSYAFEVVAADGTEDTVGRGVLYVRPGARRGA